jgi:hypothetical protein
MNIWVIKDIKFGYRYTTNKSIRNNIIDYFDNYFLNLLSSKGSSNDKLIIVGGLFSNTNPSIVAISDAYKYLTKISEIMKIVLISTSDDIRFFDGDYYSTLTLFSNINNIEVKPYNINDFISYGNCIIDVENSIIKINNEEIDIPNIIQFDDNDRTSGIFIYRISDDKYTIINNKFSPKHITYEINTFEDFKNVKKDNNIIHLIIDEKLSDENKTLLNIEIFKTNPSSIKYKSEKISEKIKLVSDFDIKGKIYDTIGENTDIKKQFDRILEICRKQI